MIETPDPTAIFWDVAQKIVSVVEFYIRVKVGLSLL